MTSRVQADDSNVVESSWANNPLDHLTRLCAIFVQELWKSAPKGQGCFHWDQDDLVTELTITDDAPISPEVAEKRPSIVLVRSQTGFAGIALDQMRNLSIKTGAKVVTDLLSGNMTFNCLSRVKTEAELIAWITGSHIWVLRHILLKLGFHDIGQRIQMMAPSPPGAIIQGDTEAEIVNVPVIVPFHFQHTVRVQDTGLKLLEKMEMTIQAQRGSTIKPTDHLMQGGWGTGLYQQDGSRVKHQNLRGNNIRPPSIRGRQLVPTIEKPYPGGTSSPVNVTLEIDEE